MNLTRFRFQCPDCSLDTIVDEDVLKDESKLPPKVTRREYDQFFCPNCSIPMERVAQVNGVGPVADTRELVPLTLEKMAHKIVLLSRESGELLADWKKKRDAATIAKKEYDGKVETIRVVSERMGRMLAGEQFEDDDYKPLLDIAEHADTTNGLDVLHEQLRERLAARDIIVTLEQVRGWSTEPGAEYDQVVKYVSALEDEANGSANSDVLNKPACLDGAPEAARIPKRKGRKKTNAPAAAPAGDGDDDTTDDAATGAEATH